MKVLTLGCKYLLSNIKSDDGDKDINTLKFYNEKGVDRDDIVGTSNQEVLRALIDRVKYLNNELPHSFNKEIIYHLRKALALHEARHLTRMVDKDFAVENFQVGNDGHFICLDKEKEHFYQDEIIQDDLAEYNGLTLTDIEKDMSERLGNIGGAASLLFQKDNKESDNICNAADDIFNAIEKAKEIKGYKEKKLFLEPTEDRLVMQDTNIPSITEAIHNAAKQDLSRKEKISNSDTNFETKDNLILDMDDIFISGIDGTPFIHISIEYILLRVDEINLRLYSDCPLSNITKLREVLIYGCIPVGDDYGPVYQIDFRPEVINRGGSINKLLACLKKDKSKLVCQTILHTSYNKVAILMSSNKITNKECYMYELKNKYKADIKPLCIFSGSIKYTDTTDEFSAIIFSINNTHLGDDNELTNTNTIDNLA